MYCFKMMIILFIGNQEMINVMFRMLNQKKTDETLVIIYPKLRLGRLLPGFDKLLVSWQPTSFQIAMELIY